jgi:hypothetical protein
MVVLGGGAFLMSEVPLSRFGLRAEGLLARFRTMKAARTRGIMNFSWRRRVLSVMVVPIGFKWLHVF